MKRQYVLVSFGVLADMFRQRIKEGIPSDAKLVESGEVIVSRGNEKHIYLTFEHESFPEIPEGVVSEPFQVIV